MKNRFTLGIVDSTSGQISDSRIDGQGRPKGGRDPHHMNAHAQATSASSAR